MTTDKAFRGFGYALGAYLNHPDYYKGRWAVSLIVQFRHMLK